MAAPYPGQYPADAMQQSAEAMALTAGQIEISPRNKDGLLIPSSKRFGVCVGIYKVLLTLTSIALVGLVIMLAFSAPVLNAARENADKIEDPGKKQDMLRMIDLFEQMMPSLIIATVFGVLQNFIAWAGMKTFRLRYVTIYT